MRKLITSLLLAAALAGGACHAISHNRNDSSLVIDGQKVSAISRLYFQQESRLTSKDFDGVDPEKVALLATGKPLARTPVPWRNPRGFLAVAVLNSDFRRNDFHTQYAYLVAEKLLVRLIRDGPGNTFQTTEAYLELNNDGTLKGALLYDFSLGRSYDVANVERLAQLVHDKKLAEDLWAGAQANKKG